ncbi:prenylated Rab acceptor protein 1-like [Platysternon megacephalum]|uniref:Prenylated Rab acceptor protein 1-like n=1 Tax=Platysternon megacephalum TaxID=55544 RepID=A0A4D9DIM1_9SAUR|nr:prenylated Rab acceptor protein 1-like [Platysternon megacephalum]
MSFSATILFSPPGAQEATGCCCACKREPGAEGAGGAPPPPCAPISVSGHGLAVQSSEQLLHVIYQRLDKAVGLAEAALALAKANNQALRRLEEEVGGLRREAHLTVKASPPPLAAEEQEEEVEAEGLGSSVQVVIEELRQLGAASGPPGRLGFSPVQPGDSGLGGVLEELPPLEVPHQRVVVPAFPTTPSPSPQPVGESSPSGSEELPPCTALEDGGPGEPRFSLGFISTPCRSRGSGPKNARRKRDLVLSKLVHNVHNHITNQRRFNGSESIKSSWNIGVVKFLLEKLRHELVTSQHNYTDKELKGACVAYFLTKRREYRNSLNPFKGLKEKEEKKLRSRRYRLFANRAGVVRLLGPEEQRLWRGVTEELMSDEEDSPSEPGVWVARSPRFRAGPLTQLCYRLDINAKHGAKANRVYGPPSERLPSAEAQLLPPHLYDPRFQEREEGGDSSSAPFPPLHKAFCPDLRPFLEIKVEKDE